MGVDMIDLRQGDCLEVMKLIPDGSVDLILTDPPYGTTACKWDTVIDLGLMWEQLKRIIKPNGAILLFSSQPFGAFLITSNPSDFRYEWVWEKSKATGHLDCNRRPLKKHENILVFSLKYRAEKYHPQGLIRLENPKINKGSRGSKGNPSGEIYATCKKDSVTRFKNYPKSIIKEQVVMRPIHPTQKPVALLEYLIKTYTQESETVLDFTMGSGSTGVAAINTNRKFIGIELDKDYFKIAEERINTATQTSGFFIPVLTSQPNAVTIGITALSDVNLAQHA